MIGKDFIISKTRCLLNEFIDPIAEKTDKPRQKFLHQTVGAILLSGTPEPAISGLMRAFLLENWNFQVKIAGKFQHNKVY